MKNRGTGWIPDYPDINDYTLQSDTIQNLTNRIQSQKETGSIESLARKVSEALGILVQTEVTDLNKKKLIDLQNGLEQEILGDNSNFVTVKLHNVFKEGMADSEVLLIKNYLQRILWTWKFNSSEEIDNIMNSLKLNDTMLDAKTIEIFNQVIKTQQRLLPTTDGSIGKNDMEVIKELADLSIIINSPSFLKNLPDRWEVWSDPPTGKEIFTKYGFEHFQSGQIKLIIHLFYLLKSLQGDHIDALNNEYMQESAINKENVEKTIQYLTKHKDDIVNGVLCVTRNRDKWIEVYHANRTALFEISNKYDPLIGVSDAENEKWINESVKELNIVLEKINKNDATQTEEIEEIKAGIEKKISEWQKFMKTVYQIVPPQIPPQSLVEEIIYVQSPIPRKFIELIKIKQKLISEQSSGSKIEDIIQPFLDAVIELISQILMPLAKYGNLNQAVEQVIQRIYFLVEEDKHRENRELIRETIEEYNFRSLRDFNFIENTDFLKFMLGVIIQQLDMRFEKEINYEFEKNKEIFSKYVDIEKKEYVKKEKDKFSEEAIKYYFFGMPGYEYNFQQYLADYLTEERFEEYLKKGKYEEYLTEERLAKYEETFKEYLEERFKEYLTEEKFKEYSENERLAEEFAKYLKTEKFAKYLKTEKFAKYLTDVLTASKDRYPLIYCLTEELNNSDPERLENLRKFVQIKKTLLEVEGINQIESINSNGKLSEQTENHLQFPINFQLRNKLKEVFEPHPPHPQEKKQQAEPPAESPAEPQAEPRRVFFSLPEFVDLSYWCSPIEDQGILNSCTAHAGIALMEYAEKKSTGNYTDGSALFLYKATRNLMQREGDSGASVRDTMKAMVAFGVCPENYWSYDEDKFDEEPTPFCYSFAENYKTLKYFRLDYGRISKYALLSQVKVLLAAELPCIFGFTLYKSVYDEANTIKGHIPLPKKQDRVIGGHTVVAVGYHDRKIVENADGIRSEGALLIRNSWGTSWGEAGYGWLPYDYIVKGLTADWWSLLKAEWLASGSFGAGASAWNADKGGTPGNSGKDQD